MRIAACLVLLIFGATSAAETALDLTPVDAASRWHLVRFQNLPATDFDFTTDGVRVSAVKSAAMLVRRLEPGVTAGSLTWMWRIDQPVPPTDLTKKGQDDRSLAVHVWFAATGKPGLWLRLKGMFQRRHDVPLKGRAISYTWGGDAPVGSLLPNPYLEKDGVIVILRRADERTGEWFGETVDVAADYRRIFGGDPPPIVAIALSADSDDSGTTGVGWIKKLEITSLLP